MYSYIDRAATAASAGVSPTQQPIASFFCRLIVPARQIAQLVYFQPLVQHGSNQKKL